MGTLSRCFVAALFLSLFLAVSNVVPANAQRADAPARFVPAKNYWPLEQDHYPPSVRWNNARRFVTPHTVTAGQVFAPSGTGIDADLLAKPTTAAPGMPMALYMPPSAVPAANVGNFGRPRTLAPNMVPGHPAALPSASTPRRLSPTPNTAVPAKLKVNGKLCAAPKEHSTVPLAYRDGVGYTSGLAGTLESAVQTDLRGRVLLK
jgi:hypothetical protein